MPLGTLALLAAAGCLGGFIDAIAGGGGLICMPALWYAQLPPLAMLGTNKFQSSVGTSLAAWRCSRARLIEWKRLPLGILMSFAGALAGAFVASRLDNSALKRIVPVMLFAVALYSLLSPRLGEGGRRRLGDAAFALIFGSVLGFYDGFFGPGTGMFWMMACVQILGYDLRHAAGTTRVLNLASNLAALLMFALKGTVRLDAGLVMIVGQLVGAQLGSGMVITKGAAVIRPVYICATLAIAGKLLWDVLG